MIGFGVLVVALGVFLMLRPQLWWRLNAPDGEKGQTPEARSLRAIRVRGVTFAVGGAALLVLQLLKVV